VIGCIGPFTPSTTAVSNFRDRRVVAGFSLRHWSCQAAMRRRGRKLWLARQQPRAVGSGRGPAFQL